MKRQLWILFTLSAVLIGLPMKSADASGFGRGHAGARLSAHGHGHGHGHSRGHGFGRGFSRGFAFGAFADDDSDFADLYRELLNNVPYFALHPPVYYSYPVPRTYGYSPFAYPPSVMTPEVAPSQPLEIINPHVPSNGETTPAQDVSDRSVNAGPQPQSLVIINPFVGPNQSVAQSER